MALSILTVLAGAHLAQAHFGIEYPPMRANTLSHNKNTTYSQWTNPCAGVPGALSSTPRTDWPLTGGSLKLDLHHDWTYIFINLGLSDSNTTDVSNFNYTLTQPFWNSTGNGTLCVPKVSLPTDLSVADGTYGSLQVVTVGEDGNALYNCADIKFSKDAKELSGKECETSEGVEYAPVAVEAAAAATGTNAGAVAGVSVGALATVVVVTVAAVFGMA